MTPDRRSVYRADWGSGPQPVRFLEVERLWTIHRTRGCTVFSPLFRKNIGPLGYLCLTRGHDPTSPDARPSTRAGDRRLAQDLLAYPVPDLPVRAGAAQRAVYGLLPGLAEQGLGLAVVHTVHHLRGTWKDFPDARKESTS